jgi:hypothetical protein
MCLGQSPIISQIRKSLFWNQGYIARQWPLQVAAKLCQGGMTGIPDAKMRQIPSTILIIS